MLNIFTSKNISIVMIITLIFLLQTSLVLSSDSKPLIIGQAAGMTTWDPHDGVATHATNVKKNVYENLTTRDEDLELVPLLATEWEPVAEKTWRFHLREGVKFHNGEKFEASDVKFSLERVSDPELGLHGTSFVGTIESVDIIDEYTVDIHTRIKDPVLPARLAFCAFILPKDTVDEVGMDDFLDKPFGTGAYKYVDWKKDEEVILERNDDYWGEKSKVKKLIFKPIPETSSRVAALQAGEIDISTNIPTDLISQIEQNEELEISGVRSARNVFIILNKNVEPFDNKLVRQALNHAIDVPTIIEYLFSGYAHQVASIGGPAWFGHNEGQEPYEYDLERARDLLSEAGYPEGFETTLAISAGRPKAANDIAMAMEQYLKRIGIKLNIVTYDWGEYIERWKKAEYPMYYMGLGTPVLDLDDFVGGYFDPSRRALWGVPPKETLELSLEALETFDTAEREEIYKEYTEEIKEDAPFIFLWNFEDLYGVNKSVEGFVPRADEQISCSIISKK